MDYFGEVSVFTKLPTTCSVDSDDLPEPLFLPKEIVNEICEMHPEFRYQMQQRMQRYRDPLMMKLIMSVMNIPWAKNFS